MRKTLTALIAALFLILTPATAMAGGSDSPTPYQVTTVGVHLPAGDTFQAHGHVNVRYFDGDGIQQTSGIHFDPNNDHPGGQWIGESFIPWSAFGITEGRIIWVQIHGYNQHFGEGGQKPVPVGPKPEPGEETREREDVAEREVTQCPSEEAGYGTVTTIRETFRVTEQRTSTIEWDGTDWIETWGDWIETDREVTSTETVQVREMTDAEYEACGLPATGAPLTAAAGMALVLVLAGVGIAVARRRTVVQ